MKNRKPNIHGGGAATNKVGLAFERATSIETTLEKKGYQIRDNTVFKGSKEVAYLYPKHDLYKILFRKHELDHTVFITKKLLPDQAILVGKTLFIIENKYQGGSGSVDEKLQTCHFKKSRYTKLLEPLGINVEYIYLLNDWFKKPEYKDVLNYVKEVGCHYYFNEIPLNILNI